MFTWYRWDTDRDAEHPEILSVRAIPSLLSLARRPAMRASYFTSDASQSVRLRGIHFTLRAERFKVLDRYSRGPLD